MASGPADALALVDLLVATGTLERYHLLSSVRGDLLDRLGRHAEAADEFDRAAALATNERERALLAERARTSRGPRLVRCTDRLVGSHVRRPTAPTRGAARRPTTGATAAAPAAGVP